LPLTARGRKYDDLGITTFDIGGKESAGAAAFHRLGKDQVAFVEIDAHVVAGEAEIANAIAGGRIERVVLNGAEKL
jgi:hypothetical protein